MNVSATQSAAGVSMLRHAMQSNAATMSKLVGSLQQPDHGTRDPIKGQNVDIRA